MKLAGKIPVEQLDEERLVNIERRIVSGAGAPMRSSPKKFPFAFAGGLVAMAAAAGVVGWMLHRAPANGSNDRVAINSGEKTSTIDIGDATIESTPNTAYVVTRPDGGVLVDMARGRVELEVGKRGSRPPLVVRAGATDVIVVGTHFTVIYDGKTDPTVTVTEGVVRVVKNHAEAARVAAGTSWTAKTGLVATRELPSTAKPDGCVDAAGTTIDCALVGPDACVDASGVAIDCTLPGAKHVDPTLDIVVNGSADLRNHVAAVPDAKLSTTPTNRVTTTATAGGPELTSRPGTKTIDPSDDPKLDVKTLIRQEPVAAPYNTGVTDAAAAIGKYFEMLRAAKSPDEESRAYYGIAYMQHLRLGRNGDALQTISNYVRRFEPTKHPAEYSAMLWINVRIACIDKVAGTDCRSAATKYLSAGGPERTANVARLLAE